MAEFDLRALSAPFEALRPDVNAAYQRLEAKWEAVANQLRKLPIPCKISVSLWESPQCPDDCTCLEFRKWKGHKRICLTEYHVTDHQMYEIAENVTPIDEWSGEQKLNFLESVPRLFEVGLNQVKAFVKKTEKMGERT